MPRQVPGPGPDDEQARACAGAAFPPGDGFGPGSGRTVWPDGLDYQALLDGLAASGFLGGRPEDQDAVLAEEIAAAQEGRLEPGDPAQYAALAVEYMDPGPAQAGWLEVAAAQAGLLDENALAGMLAGAQKLASRGQALGLTAAAQITARAAAADPKIGVASDGRPVRLCRDGLEQIRLALMLTDYSTAAWADLAVTLAWRLPATGRALAGGIIDYWRARLIVNATSVLPQDTARVTAAPVRTGRAAAPMTAAPVTTAWVMAAPAVAAPATVAVARTGPAATSQAAGRGMTCPRRAMRTPRPTTVLMTCPARTRTTCPGTRPKKTTTPPGPARRRSGPRSA